MTASNRPVRLSKAAREFNISLDKIVDYLADNGFEVDRSPNFKLDQDMYAMLTSEFQEEKHVKEISQQKGLEYVGKKTITIDDIKDKGNVKPDDDYLTDEIIITNVGVDYETATYAPSAPPKPEPEEETKPKEEKVEMTEEIVEEPPVVEEVQAKAVKEEVIEEPIREEVEEAVAGVTPEVEEKTEEATTETKEEKEVGGPKVVGKVDLSSINQRTRPKRKSKAEKQAESEAKKKTVARKAGKKTEPAETKPVKEPAQEKAPAAEESKAKKPEAEKEEKKDNFIPTKFKKLAGPKVVDKIELPAKPKPSKKKPVASSSDDKVGQKKKKRRRIRSGGAAPERAGAQRDKRRPRGKKREQKPELTEEDVQKQIKETLARLAPSGKSSAAKHRKQKRAQVSQTIEEEQKRQEEEKSILKVTEFLTANELANMMDVGVTDIIKSCMQLGMIVSINQRLDAEAIVLVAEEFGYSIEFVSIDDSDDLEVIEEEDDPDSLVGRAPIVTVMGHVDHGKTKLLDYIRKANVVAGEAGGITQHIGAYEVMTDKGGKVTFLDTPGHEAFTAMRARGAKVTDIVIIVIAADDSVMPQTKEAIHHAQAAGVPIVFAFNKMDRPGANAEKIREQLSTMNILVEEWGGKFQTQEISAITGQGIGELLEKVLLEAELLELTANAVKPAKGTVIEATLDKGRGYVATMLVQEGRLAKGDLILAGPIYGKVKAMANERNQLVDVVGPSTPVVILGLNNAPQAGDVFNVMTDEKQAKSLANKRQQLLREQKLHTTKHITLDEIGRRIAIGDFKELNIIVKGDVDGSVEALSDELLKLSTEEVQVQVIHKAVGAITETDVSLASASNAIIIGFQVRPIPQARKAAEKEQIDIRLYSIIYQATEELKAAIKGMLAPQFEEKITCNIEVRDVFKITKVGTVAGCYVLDGKINRNTSVRLIRDGIVVYTGKLGSLKRFKDDVKEVASGYECGLNIENFNDIKVGDIVEGYEQVEIAR